MIDLLAPFLVRWLTHDLATPTATVLTASELLSDTPDAEINDLVTDGARRLAARLRLIRAALAPGEAAIGGAALVRLISEGIDGTPLVWASGTADATRDAPGGDAAGLPAGHAAALAGAVMLLADLRRGQPLAIGSASVAWMTLQPPLPAAVAAALAGAAPTDPRSALATMVRAAASRAGLTITLTADGLRWS